MKVVLVDDEKHALETLEWELQQCQYEVEILAKFDKSEEALKYLKSHRPDVLFLDIEMPFMNGFELLDSLENIDFEVVFTTAYDQFALNAFKVSALDYLLKPIDRKGLEEALDKAEMADSSKFTKEQLNILVQKLKGDNQKVALPSFDGLEFVELEEILRCKSDSNYSNIHLVGGKKILVSKTLKQIEELLKDGPFFRVHNSHLINLKRIKKYIKGDGGYVVLDDDSKIDVARSRKKDFLDIFS